MTTKDAVEGTAGVSPDQRRQRFSDGLGRLTKVLEDADGSNLATTYTYDAADRLLTVNQGDRPQRIFTYSRAGWLMSAFNGESGTTQYSYTPAGRLLTKKDANDVVTCMGTLSGSTCTKSIDAAGRPLRKSYSDVATQPVTYIYTNGWLTQVDNSDVVVTYGYDALDRVTLRKQSVNSLDYQHTATYRPAGQASETYTSTSGRVVSYGVDAVGRVTSVTGTKSGAPTSYVQDATYAPHGAAKWMKFGNNQEETRTWDHRLQPLSIVRGTGLQLNYYYCSGTAVSCAGNNGNVLSQTIGHANATQTYQYDVLGRLTQATEGSTWSRTYGYDAYGNQWVSATTGLVTDPFTPVAGSNFDGNNQMTKGSPEYSAAGQQERIGGYVMTYDAEGRMRTSTLNGTTTTMTYDGEGRRVKKVSGSRTTLYVYGVGGELTEEFDTAPPAASSVQYYASDMLGSTRVVFDGAGTAVKCLDYVPFGEQIPQGVGAGRTGSCWAVGEDPRVKFTGQVRDVETNLDYLGARYFSGAQGRMTSPDPFTIVVAAENREQLDSYLSNPQSWNRYAYALNNPLHYVDPTGLNAISVGDCRKDSNCTVVTLNVILDENADIYDENGDLRQEYQAKLDAQISQAADEYGNANIAFDVRQTSGSVTANNTVTGGQAGALNLVVTDSRDSYGNYSWIGSAGSSFTRLNIGTSQTDTIAHEISHHLTGDTRSWAIPLLSNTLGDYNNDIGRFFLRNWNTPIGRNARKFDPFLYLHRRDIMQNARRWYGGR